jgi:hypothetical protein
VLVFLLALVTAARLVAAEGFAVNERPEKLVITHGSQPVAEYVFRDDKILRPYFTKVHAPSGAQVTRNHPPIAGQDAADHDLMHPGIWLAFGDVSGHDFWRNKGRIEHVRFRDAPKVDGERLTFATESRLVTEPGKPVCGLVSEFRLTANSSGWLLAWSATIPANAGDVTFGDQEEMGFGARVATPLAEKNGGTIVNSAGQRTAGKTWGQAAAWCDYFGQIDGKPAGITLMAGPKNFRESWWHNRDYGLMVANPFGREAMKRGANSAVVVKRGESLTLDFAACLHSADDYDPKQAYREFVDSLR